MANGINPQQKDIGQEIGGFIKSIPENVISGLIKVMDSANAAAYTPSRMLGAASTYRRGVEGEGNRVIADMVKELNPIQKGVLDSIVKRNKTQAEEALDQGVTPGSIGKDLGIPAEILPQDDAAPAQTQGQNLNAQTDDMLGKKGLEKFFGKLGINLSGTRADLQQLQAMALTQQLRGEEPMQKGEIEKLAWTAALAKPGTSDILMPIAGGTPNPDYPLITPEMAQRGLSLAPKGDTSHNDIQAYADLVEAEKGGMFGGGSGPFEALRDAKGGKDTVKALQEVMKQQLLSGPTAAAKTSIANIREKVSRGLKIADLSKEEKQTLNKQGVTGYNTDTGQFVDENRNVVQ